MNIPGIDILNTGTGHTEVRFEKGDDLELARAGRVISDMLRRGYVLFVEGPDKALIRVEKFDPEINAYIIADSAEYSGDGELAESVPVPEVAPPGGRRVRPRKTAIPINKVRATAIGRSAGG